MNWLIGKDPDAGKDWRQEEKGTTEDEMIEWYHWLNGHEFAQALGVGDGQGRLVCCSPWGCKESDMTERLNWTDSFIWLHWVLDLAQGILDLYCGPWNLWGTSLVAQPVKNLLAMWEAWGQSLSWKDPLEKKKATHSSILDWRIPWTV